MSKQIEKAVERVLNEFLQGREPSDIDEKGAEMFWDLSRSLVDHLQAEIGEPMEASDLVYYSLYEVIEFLFKRFTLLIAEALDLGDDNVQ